MAMSVRTIDAGPCLALGPSPAASSSSESSEAAAPAGARGGGQPRARWHWLAMAEQCWLAGGVHPTNSTVEVAGDDGRPEKVR
jgi:hypothetical protein